MRSIYQTYILFFSLLISITALAQQDPHFTKYMYRNQSLYNPAATGRAGDYHLGLAYRMQWIGIEGAPSTMACNFETSMDDNKAALGVNLYHDKIGFDQNLSLQINYAYRIFLQKDQVISLGIKGGVNMLNADFGNAHTPEGADPTHLVNTTWIPRAGLGAMYFTNKFYVSLSIPALVALAPGGSFRWSDDDAFLSKHFYGGAGYVFDLKKDVFQIKPFVFAKWHPAAPFQCDLGVQFWYKDVFSFGSSYRTGDAIAAMVEIPVVSGLHLSYAYDYTNSLFRNIGSGAHEINIEYTWNRKKPKIPSIHKISNLPRF